MEYPLLAPAFLTISNGRLDDQFERLDAARSEIVFVVCSTTG
jgi:hypothetical protein